MSGHQYTADMVNEELDKFLELQEGSLDSIMAQMNPNPDFSAAPEIHGSLENNTQSRKTTQDSISWRSSSRRTRSFHLMFHLLFHVGISIVI